MTWNCEQIEGRLSEYVDGLLEAGESREFEAHVAGCARCAPLVKSVSVAVAGMHRLEPLEAPPRLLYNILDQTLGPRAKKEGFQAWLRWLRPVWQPRFAYGAVTVVVTISVLFQALGFQWRKSTLAELSPVNLYRAADRRAHLIYARGSKFVTDLRVVYEIQSRLRPEAEPQPAPEQKPNPSQPPGQSNGPQPTSPRELNRANDKNWNLSVLACALGAVPEGRVR
jgi:anti-sigma factor RsiW